MTDRTTRPTDDDPLTVTLELVDVLAVLRLLERAGQPPAVNRLEARAACRVDAIAARALFPAGSAIAGLLPAILGTGWHTLAGVTEAERITVKPQPGR